MVPSPTGKEQGRNTKKARPAGGSGEPKPRPLQDTALNCPRCCSTNTKFCYYNNYNLTQPRYFCKACRRYWTQGGTLRNVPVGGGCRRNKRASGSCSSSAAAAAPLCSSATATGAEMVNTVNTRLMLMSTAGTTMSTTISMPSPATGLFPSSMLPTTFTPTGSSGFHLAMDDQQQQGFLPFAQQSLSHHHHQALELAPAGNDTTPTFLDMLTGGYLDGGRSISGSGSGYGAGLAMSGGGSNGMDMPFLLPGMGAASATVPMQTQLLAGMRMNDVAGGGLQWVSSEPDNYTNDDGGYAAGPAAGLQHHQQQQVVGDQQQQEENNQRSKNNNGGGGGGSSAYSYYWTSTSNSDGAEG